MWSCSRESRIWMDLGEWLEPIPIQDIWDGYWLPVRQLKRRWAPKIYHCHECRLIWNVGVNGEAGEDSQILGQDRGNTVSIRCL